MDFVASPLSYGEDGSASPFFQVNWNLLVKNSDFLSAGEYLLVEKSEDSKSKWILFLYMDLAMNVLTFTPCRT